MLLQNKVTIITGAGQGIGRVAARRFAGEGARVVVNDINGETAAETVALIKEDGGEAMLVVADIADDGDAGRLISEAISHFGSLHVLYNNAGIFLDGDGTLPEPDIWEKTLHVNLTGTYLCCRHAIPEMAKGGGGSIINTGSAVAVRGPTFAQDAYAVSKGALITYTQALAVIHGKDGVRVNCLIPGPIETPMLAQSDPGTVKLDRIPLRRRGKPEEVAALAAFLASDEASWISGAIVPVDGGLTATFMHPNVT
jgi:NAD(P)-dependent dehydrogenase (short-subunit alcohol dehydrogenase family)